jgi:hypothetical protein
MRTAFRSGFLPVLAARTLMDVDIRQQSGFVRHNECADVIMQHQRDAGKSFRFMPEKLHFFHCILPVDLCQFGSHNPEIFIFLALR